jgi:hypothetical protein
VTTRGTPRRGRRLALCAGVGVAATLAVVAGVVGPGRAGATTAAAKAPARVKLSAGPLGIDVAPWTNPATLSALQADLKAAGVTELHYGGGVTADSYDWQTDEDISNCPTTAPAEYTAGCAYKDMLPFSTFSKDARALGAQSVVSVNYGTGSGPLAEAWVKQASTTAGQGVAGWEIGNESYGCWENNNELAGPPEDYVGYEPNIDTTCPMNQPAGLDAGMEIMADSYAANAGTFMADMKAADPSAVIGVPWAFDWTVGGATVGDNGTWNDTVLQADGPDIGFVDAHWYPYGFGGPASGTDGRPTYQQVIQSVEQIPGEYAKIRSTLNTYDPTAKVLVGETGVSYLATNVPCTPAGALFAAGDALEWLAAGAESLDWWPLDTNAQAGDKNQSLCEQPDEGMFTSNGTPDQAYYGYLLASQLARPNAELSALTSSNSNVLAFQSVLSNGQVAVALINTNTASTEKVKVSTSLAGKLSTESYIPANLTAATTKIVDGTTTASAVAGGVSLRPESIVILKSYKPTTITLGTGIRNNTIKAGAKVTLKGKLTLNGAAAPAGVTVKIYRRVAGSSANSATLTVKTVKGGTFTATNVPPKYGTYDYIADYPSGTYPAGTDTLLVHITAAKPSLKLAVSAKSVKPGSKVTVTATLSDPHVNRTLITYAQPSGAGKTVIKHATVNSKDRVSVTYTVRANTTFTVTFSGDTWYSPASASAAVKG